MAFKKTYRRRNNKNKRTSRKQRKQRKQQGGGTFKLGASLGPEDVCNICFATFAETPELIAFTTKACKHTFHAKCLVQWCEAVPPGQASVDIDTKGCPTCRAPLKEDCMQVWAFVNKALANSTFSGNTKIAELYHAQPNV
jgi:hypothetical protein